MLQQLESRWKSCFTAILIVSPYAVWIFFYTLFESKANYGITGYISMQIIGLPIYLISSLVGWLFIGIPIHRVIEKYTAGHWSWYLVTSVIACVLVTLIPPNDRDFFFYYFGIPILLQANFFKYYFEKYNV